MNNIKMLYIDRTDISKSIDVNQTSVSKEVVLLVIIFLDKGFKFQQDVCNRCHDILTIYLNLSNIAILNIS